MGLQFLNCVLSRVKSEVKGVKFRKELKFYLSEQSLYSIEKFFEPDSFSKLLHVDLDVSYY